MSVSTVDVKTFFSQYIFAYAYPVAFAGAVFLGISEIVGISPLSVINEKLGIAVNILIGFTGLLSLFNWFNQPIPVIGEILVNRDYVKNKY
jgi:hypothetical protein